MGETRYSNIISGFTWSYSRIECFHDCPYRFFLRYILEEKPRPQFYSSYGKFVHDLLARYYKGELTKEELPLKYLLDFQKEVQGARPAPHTAEKYFNQGLEYMKSFEPLPFRVLDVEKRFYFNLNGIPLVGQIDLVCQTEGGKLVVVDHKSRELTQRSGRSRPTRKDEELDKMLRQLYLYSLAVFQEYRDFPSLLCFNCFRNQELIIEPFDRKAFDRALTWAMRSVRQIEDETDFPPHVDYFPCRNLCDLSHECCYRELCDT